MSARVLSFSSYTPKPGRYALLLCQLPGRGVETVGVVLLDEASNNLHLRLRRDWDEFASEEDAEVLREVEDDLAMDNRERGGRAVFDYLQSDSSTSLRVTDAETITVRDFERTLGDLYREHVPAHVLRFRTHLPRYSLAVAAGPFLSNPEDIQAEDWIETPAGLRLDEDMFIARIEGHSMEPRIPHGSFCIFRRNVVGSRNNRLVLVRNTELADDNQYTVKRYKSEKRITGEGFQQTRIRLESLNPAYPSWDLDEDSEKYQVVAEFVQVLE
jgi:phage repressor protein C with HTH and peptisase S24 domain